MAESLLSNVTEFTVGQLAGAIRKTLEGTFDRVRVRGELGRVTRHSNGHIYLDLKDEAAVISGVVWRGQAARLKVKLEEGIEVIATGRVSTFGPQSKYQLIIDEIELAGLGALMALLEKRKAKLAAEGLFASERKKPIPFLPDVIGVVTSPTGAVIRDILHRLRDRFPRRVLLWPVTVQGERAAGEIAAAIEGFNRLTPFGTVPRPDLLIVARGGGSLEDLMAFNEELVVRAAAASDIPLISAVGHETDTTLIDFASDLRAPTPTAAAELAVPLRAELTARLAGLEQRRVQAVLRQMTQLRRHVEGLARALPRPEDLIGARRQRLDASAFRLVAALRTRAGTSAQKLARLSGRLSPALLSGILRVDRKRLGGLSERLVRAADRQRRGAGERLMREGERLQGLAARLTPAIKTSLERRTERLAAAGRLLKTVSFEGTLERGFALVTTAKGAVVRSAAAAAAAETVDIQFHGSEKVSARITAPRAHREVVASPEAPKHAPTDRQGRLL